MTRRAKGSATQGDAAISDAREAQARLVDRLLRENAELRAIVDTTPTGLLTLDTRGTVLDANAAAVRMLGGLADLEGKLLPLLVATDDRRVIVEHIRETLAGVEGPSCQVAFERSGRPPFVGALQSVAIRRAGVPLEIRTSLTDATHHWREATCAAWRLRDEQARLAAALAAQRTSDRIADEGAQLAESLDLEETVARAARLGVPHLASYCAIDLVDADGRVRRAAFTHEREGHPDLPLDPYAPQGSARVVRTGEQALFPHLELSDLLSLSARPEDLRTLRANLGSYLCLPLRAHGRTIGAMTFARALDRASFERDEVALALEVGRRTALAIDNARLYREAHEGDRRKDEFLAMLGHELRNPLAAIVFATARLKRDAAGSPVVEATAEVIERQGKRLVRLVDDLVDVSRVTRGKIALQKERVVLCEIVADAVDSVRPLVEARGHKLTVQTPSDPILLDADPARLEQVLVNLLTNAAKYTDPGGHLSLDVSRHGGDAILRVRDDGIGVPPEMLKSIFAPFSQIGAALDRTDRGLGIGLALARSLVELHGGQITAHSEGLGRGTEIVVRLPRWIEPAERAPLAPPPREPSAPKALEGAGNAEAAPPSARRRVLVVDDQIDLAELLDDELSSMGHEVRVAHDGLEALEAARAFSPELMFVDLGLPGLTGYEVAAQIRSDPALASATLVALTGYGGEETTSRCRAAGFDAHCTKPIGEDELKRLLAG